MPAIHERIRNAISGHHKWVHSKFVEIASKESTPHEVAFGFALGLFVGLATPGFDIPVVLFLILTFKVHRLAVLMGAAIINPITTAFIYPFSFEVGKLLVGYDPIMKSSLFSWHTLLSISKPLLIGNLVLAVILGFISYFIVYSLYYFFHYRKLNRA